MGLPYLAERYPPQLYGEHPQNWSVTQDERGLTYVANNNGILEYDGERWRTIPTRTRTFVRSLAYGAAGSDTTVWVGVQSDLGYLRADSLGVMRYESLFSEVSPKDRTFGDVWATHAAGGHAVFQAEQHLFAWDGAKMKSWESRARGFHTSFAVRDEVYVREKGRGLLRLEGDSLQLMPGGERFAKTPVHLMAPYPDGRILVGTAFGAFYLYDPSRAVSQAVAQADTSESPQFFEPFETEATGYIEDARLYHGCALSDGYYALATLGAGVLIIDAEGRVVQVLSGAGELPDNVVNYVYAGRQGALWVALNSGGIYRARIPSVLTVYDSELGLRGAFYQLERHEGTLYTATGSGLYRLRRQALMPEVRAREERSAFEPVPGVPPPAWDLASTKHGLLAATDRGVYLVREGAPAEWLTMTTALSLEAPDAPTAGPVFAGTEEGLIRLERTASGTWETKRVPGVESEVRSIWAAPGGRALWLSNIENEVLRLVFPKELGTGTPEVKRFAPGTASGLPSGVPLSVAGIDGRLAVTSVEGVFRLRPGESVKGTPFQRDDGIGHWNGSGEASDRSEGAPLRSVVEAPSGNVWVAQGSAVHVASSEGHEREIGALQFPKGRLVQLYVEEDARGVPTVWLTSDSELIRYDSALDGIGGGSGRPLAASRLEDRAGFSPSPPLIRRVAASGPNAARLIYGGARPPGGAYSDEARRVPYNLASVVSFAYAAPDYAAPGRTTYQHRLLEHDAEAGAEEAWSAWAPASTASFDGLWEGAYRFEVRARNGRGFLLPPATFSFRVLPPWYRTAWAYLCYVLAFVGAALGWRYVRHRQHAAREQARELQREREARERLEAANARFEEANVELERANRLKDTFLANTSHELRTPMTAILGFAKALNEEAQDREAAVQKQEAAEEEFVGLVKEFAGIIETSGRRLLETLNALLDIAQIRAGIEVAQAEPTDLCAEAASLVRLFSALAKEQQIELALRCPGGPVYADVVPELLRRVMQNLIGNAVKFTSEGGVTVEVAEEGAAPGEGNGAEAASAGHAVVTVTDTGQGIVAEFMPELFEAFKQESAGLSRSHEGSGLGLAIAKELTEAMGGEITAESAKGEGSTFTVRLPLSSKPPAPGLNAEAAPALEAATSEPVA